MSKRDIANLTKAERDDLSKQVKPLRQGAGWKQSELAEMAGVTRQTIIGIESGVTTPQAANLARVLRVLGVDLESPEYQPQTELWLSMFGTLIEAIPESRRARSVDAAMRSLGQAIKNETDATVTPITRNVTPDLHTVDIEEELYAADVKNQGPDEEQRQP